MAARNPREVHRLIAVIEDRRWSEFALCRGRLDLFFEPRRERPLPRARREEQAKQLCSQCPVSSPCRESGRRNHESGIWGGETEEERIAAGFNIRTVTRASVMAARSSHPAPISSDPTWDPEVA